MFVTRARTRTSSTTSYARFQRIMQDVAATRRRASPQLRSVSTADNIQVSAGEDEATIRQNVKTLTVGSGGKWTLNDSALERVFRFKTFKITWVSRTTKERAPRGNTVAIPGFYERGCRPVPERATSSGMDQCEPSSVVVCMHFV